MNVLTKSCLRVVSCRGSISSISRSSTFKSSICLENLYPNSKLSITTPNEIPEHPIFSGYIPLERLDITYSKSTGPGGQLVNKVFTKVDLRFHVESAEWLSDEIKRKLLEQHKTKINKEGYFIIRSEKTRSQQLNLADALESLRTLIRALTVSPPEVSQETLEKHRRKKEKAIIERMMEKRRRGNVKLDRQGVTVEL